MIRLNAPNVESFSNTASQFNRNITIDVDTSNDVGTIPSFSEFRPFVTLLENRGANRIVVGAAFRVNPTEILVDRELTAIAKLEPIDHQGHISMNISR